MINLYAMLTPTQQSLLTRQVKTALERCSSKCLDTQEERDDVLSEVLNALFHPELLTTH